MHTDRQIAVWGGWIAGPAFGVAMMAAPEYLHLKPALAAAFFWGGILVFVVTVFVVAALQRREREIGRKPMWPIIAMAAGVTIFGIGAAGYFWPGSSSIDEASRAPAVSPSVTAPILFDCQYAKLPTTVPASGHIATMDIVSKLDFGGAAIYLGNRHGEPGEKWTWFESDRELGGVWRCDIKNYADFAIFNVAMNFKEEFREAKTTKENPGASSAGDVVEALDRPVVITNIDAKSTFSFYAYSQSRYYAHVFLPSEVTYLRAGRETRETAQLLPPSMGGGMSFWPVKIIERAKPEDKQDIKNKLGVLYSDSDSLWRRLVTVPKTISDSDYKKLQQDIDQWSLALEKFIKDALGAVEASRLLEVSSDLPAFNPEEGYTEDIAKDRAATLFALNAQRRNLAKLIDRQKSP